MMFIIMLYYHVMNKKLGRPIVGWVLVFFIACLTGFVSVFLMLGTKLWALHMLNNSCTHIPTISAY